MDILKLKIITPKQIILEKEVTSITVPTVEGEITILPHHINLFSMLEEGVIHYKTENSEDFLAIGGGFAETDGESVNILVSHAYGQDKIDADLTLKAIAAAKNDLKQVKDEKSRLEATRILRKSIVDMKLLKKRRHRV